MTLDQVVAAVLAGSKYHAVCEEFVRRVSAQEMVKGRNFKETVKAVKNKLHQTGGAYLSGNMRYADWLITLQNAPDQTTLRAACQKIMAAHASTKERLPILEHFYQAALADIAPVKSVLDIACGLNPLAIPWMPLALHASYFAYDIFEDMTDFVGQFIKLMNLEGYASARDMGQFQPPEKVDLALVLKTLPCLEQVEKTVSLHLLDSLNAEHILVSFPVRSLGGRQKGMAATYEAHLNDLLAGKNWRMQRFEFSTELAFLITKHE